jgi:hypothetical protein
MVTNQGRGEGKVVNHAIIGNGDVAATVHGAPVGGGRGRWWLREKSGPVYKGNSYIRQQTRKNIVMYFTVGVWGHWETVMLVPGNC